MDELLRDAAERAIRYVGELPERRVAPDIEALKGLERFDEPLPEGQDDPGRVLALLDEAGSPATVATAGPRFFGFVIGGSHPVSLAANWLAGAWDQNAGAFTASPVAATLERVAQRWLIELFGLPSTTVAGFVTGATMANMTALAAARNAVLARVGWDVDAQGLAGAPLVTVIAGDEVHPSLVKGLGLLGLGRDRVVRVPVDDQGRMRADALPAISGPTIVCVQAGNVNTGACDPFTATHRPAHETGAWVHVDGAFGLWAAAAPRRAHLGAASARRLVGDRRPQVAERALRQWVRLRPRPARRCARRWRTAAYLPESMQRELAANVPESSRRARGLETWAALRRSAVPGWPTSSIDTAATLRAFAQVLRDLRPRDRERRGAEPGAGAFGDDETTRRVVAAIQEDGTCWAGVTVWQGRTAQCASASPAGRPPRTT